VVVELSLFVEEVGVTDSEGAGADVEDVLSVEDVVGEDVGVLVGVSEVCSLDGVTTEVSVWLWLVPLSAVVEFTVCDSDVLDSLELDWVVVDSEVLVSTLPDWAVLDSTVELSDEVVVIVVESDVPVSAVLVSAVLVSAVLVSAVLVSTVELSDVLVSTILILRSDSPLT